MLLIFGLKIQPAKSSFTLRYPESNTISLEKITVNRLCDFEA